MMIAAELRGKFSPSIERMEDILTSNVFSFLKYSDRGKCLRAYLKEEFGLEVSEEEAEKAEFRFWHLYEEGTEPDVIIIVGDFYLLFEAKYLSGFGVGSDTRDPQTEREVCLGLKEAELLGKEFRFIPITADFYFKEDKGFSLKGDMVRYVSWTSWQRFASFLESLLESGALTASNEIEFAVDLLELLDRKNLRGFHGYRSFEGKGIASPLRDFFFYDAGGSTFRGAFIGFAKTLSTVEEIGIPSRILFIGATWQPFWAITDAPEIIAAENGRLFWEVEDGG